MRTGRGTHTGSEVSKPLPAHSLPVGIAHVSRVFARRYRGDAYRCHSVRSVAISRCFCTLFFGLFVGFFPARSFGGNVIYILCNNLNIFGYFGVFPILFGNIYLMDISLRQKQPPWALGSIYAIGFIATLMRMIILIILAHIVYLCFYFWLRPLPHLLEWWDYDFFGWEGLSEIWANWMFLSMPHTQIHIVNCRSCSLSVHHVVHEYIIRLCTYIYNLSP